MIYRVYHTPYGHNPATDDPSVLETPRAFHSEQGAVDHVRHSYPDGIAMPIPLTSKGPAGPMAMGVIADAAAALAAQQNQRTILFVMHVVADPVGSAWADRRAISKGRMFTRELWTIPPVERPHRVIAVTKARMVVSMEGFPDMRDVVLGKDEKGRFVLYCEAMPGNAVSFTFDEVPTWI